MIQRCHQEISSSVAAQKHLAELYTPERGISRPPSLFQPLLNLACRACPRACHDSRLRSQKSGSGAENGGCKSAGEVNFRRGEGRDSLVHQTKRWNAPKVNCFVADTPPEVETLAVSCIGVSGLRHWTGLHDLLRYVFTVLPTLPLWLCLCVHMLHSFHFHIVPSVHSLYLPALFPLLSPAHS